MKNIKIEGVSKSYGDELVFENLNLTIPAGKFFALLGPSGCGKTTILRLIGGFETPDSGTIHVGDVDITHLPIHQRNINTVFQNYALFPHLNVFENVAYSQRVKGVDPIVIEQRVYKILKIVRLESHALKLIDQLSGGQKQRVALARAIINEPDVLLLDEPLTALDPQLREKMLLELIELQATLKTTFVYVTHDHFEALAVADHMAILNNNGEIEQIGTPTEIYEFPISSFVAQFVGITNLLEGTVTAYSGTEATVQHAFLGTLKVYVAEYRPWAQPGATVLMSIRPEKIFISKKELSTFSNKMTGKVEGIIYYGRSTQYNIKVANGLMISVFEQNEEHFEKEVIDYNEVVNMYWHKESMVLLER